MDAVKFIKERDRMFEVEGTAPVWCYGQSKSAEDLVREVEEWSIAHPRKTRQSVFLEQYPNAKVDKDTGILETYPCNVDRTMQELEQCKTISCADCRREFWLKEVK